jgi:hypothetical protein
LYSFCVLWIKSIKRVYYIFLSYDITLSICQWTLLSCKL